MRSTIAKVLTASSLLLAMGASWAQQEPLIDPSQLRVTPPAPIVRAMQSARLASGVRAASPVRRFAASLAPTLRTFRYSVVSPRDGQTYTGSIVGADPRANGARTTAVEIVIIPIRIAFTGTVRTFDPTQPDPGCLGPTPTATDTALKQLLGSPLLNPVPNYTINGENIGNVTFTDAFQRAQFWRTSIGGPLVSVKPAYHLALSPVTVMPVQTISMANDTAGSGATYTLSPAGTCSTNLVTDVNPPRLAVVDINYMDAQLNTILANLNLNASQFPFFVTYGTVMSFGPPGNLSNNCCVLGYHSTVTSTPTPTNFGQTYGISNYFQNLGNNGVFGGVSDASTVAHEILEWVNDPSGMNMTPQWGNIGQVGGCLTTGTGADAGQSNFEVGDPLSGTTMPGVVMPNGIDYNIQELAFFNWFLGDVAFQAAGHKYSSNGTFSGDAKPCPPGGTN
ncbi:MAG: hypothetical protein KGL18_09385 [Burkholderiales bacterium]|nr:hypothetical protein [Burkholderiales bacterium]MDE1928859.1 hypothetical protein [Burkholderiales bacterium]MDE2159722.1 hypothetical protein [Burkholderiales bacterium]MDE2503170.1 hypothetical protein [Burkholderiales bacterium]